MKAKIEHVNLNQIEHYFNYSNNIKIISENLLSPVKLKSFLKNQGKLKDIFIKFGIHYNIKDKNLQIKNVDVSGIIEKLNIKNYKSVNQVFNSKFNGNYIQDNEE